MRRTAQQVIDAALRELNVLPVGGSATGAQFTEALSSLNELIQSWSAYGLQGWAQAKGTLTLTSGSQSYVLGTGGTITARPHNVSSVLLRDSAGQDVALSPMTRSEYLSLALKTTPGTPARFYYDPENAAYGTLYIYPVADSSGYSAVVDYERPLTELTAAGDYVDAPGDMLRALKWNLVVEIASGNGRTASDHVIRMAGETLPAAIGTAKRIPEQPLVGWPQ